MFFQINHAARFVIAVLTIVFMNGFPSNADTIERNYPQQEVPSFWKGAVDNVMEMVASVERGKTKAIAISPGGRPVYLFTYGPTVDLQSQANYGSAAAARDPGYYARKKETDPPIVYIIGGPHGQEMEGVVGLVNLIQVAETGKDFRGKEWPRLRENFDKCRVVIAPLANPDGRARCPYDSFIGIPVDEMTRVGQGTRKDGTNYGWPGAKKLHPMKGDVGILGAYFNDDGINLMHDEFMSPMADETEALLRIAREEAPDYILNLHSHGAAPMILSTAYVPWYHKVIESHFSEILMKRYQDENLPAARVCVPSRDGEKYPPPSFNLTSALHHCCGGVSMLFECPHGLKEERYPQVNHEQILDIELILYEEFLALAVKNPRPRPLNEN